MVADVTQFNEINGNNILKNKQETVLDVASVLLVEPVSINKQESKIEKVLGQTSNNYEMSGIIRREITANQMG